MSVFDSDNYERTVILLLPTYLGQQPAAHTHFFLEVYPEQPKSVSLVVLFEF